MHLECFGLHCMLRHRKSQLVRELWRASERLWHVDNGQLGTVEEDSYDIKIRLTLRSIMKHLDVDELEMLLEAVKSKGRSQSQCIHMCQRAPATTCRDTENMHSATCQEGKEQRADVTRVSDHHLSSPISTSTSRDIISNAAQAVCKAWRWPDLHCNQLLKPLADCQIPEGRASTDNYQPRVCINPFHWSKVLDIISGR